MQCTMGCKKFWNSLIILWHLRFHELYSKISIFKIIEIYEIHCKIIKVQMYKDTDLERLHSGTQLYAWCSERQKPLFWFRSNTETETQIGWYFRLIPQSIPKPHFREKIYLPIVCRGIFSIIKGHLKPNLLPNIKDFSSFFKICVQFQVFKNLYPLKKQKNMIKFEKKKRNKFRFQIKKFRLQYRYWNTEDG